MLMGFSINDINSGYPYIYKYRVCNQIFWDGFYSNKLWFSSPLDFNDPYDCYEYLLGPPEDKNQLIKYMQSVGENHGMTSAEIDRITDFANNDFELVSQDFIDTMRRSQIERLAICSMSEVSNDVVLWSHYADGHKGVCLIFDTKCDTAF